MKSFPPELSLGPTGMPFLSRRLGACPCVPTGWWEVILEKSPGDHSVWIGTGGCEGLLVREVSTMENSRGMSEMWSFMSVTRTKFEDYDCSSSLSSYDCK